MGLGEIFALICALLWASAVVLYKYAGDSMSANSLNLVKNIVGLSLLLPTAWYVEGAVMPTLSTYSWLIVIASGYLGIAVADTLYLQALRTIGASRTAIVGSLYSPFVVLLSMLFLAERLAGWQWFGFIMVLAGIMVVVYQRSQKELDPGLLVKGAFYASTSVFLTAAGVVAMKPILSDETSDGAFFWLVTLRMLAGIVGMLIYLLVTKKLATTYAVIVGEQHKWRTIVLASFLGSYLALLFWLAGFKYADASVASVLNETANVFIVIMAAIFLSEALTKRKIAGVVLTFSGVLIFLGL